ncbi:MAG TPA: 2OG-Fe(II) oxygenase family protein [Allosphingosinicella sp.]|uniref:2OG-Fe(II) oxygenase n=1 Tax=Allosphingosinicella sp. TaxID=2823234 RepID=UPI002F299577
MGASRFALNPRLDRERLAEDFARRGRLHIPSFLDADGGDPLLQHLKARDDWRLVINQGEKLFELERKAQAQLTPVQLEQLETAVRQAARQGFQFRFETIRVPDPEQERAKEGSLLSELAIFLSSYEVLGFFRQVTGRPEIAFADAQGTAYGPGHFLTVHDDEVAGKDRVAAYVLNLTPEWRIDWGGLLMFHGADGHVEEAYAPRFNALNIFSVPQAHSVSYVTPFVPNRRYAVTGWLRASPKP